MFFCSKHDCHIIISAMGCSIEQNWTENRTEQRDTRAERIQVEMTNTLNEQIATNDKEKELKKKHENEWLIGINTQETRNACMEWRKKSSNVNKLVMYTELSSCVCECRSGENSSQAHQTQAMPMHLCVLRVCMCVLGTHLISKSDNQTI